MGMLAEQAEYVIGVDTHRDAHSAAAITIGTGALLAQTTVAADAFGHKALDECLDRRDQLGDVVVDAAADLLLGQDREPDLDHWS